LSAVVGEDDRVKTGDELWLGLNLAAEEDGVKTDDEL